MFQITDLHLTEMEDRCGESRVHARECLEEGDEILDLARTAGSDHRHMDSLTDLLQHLQVKALLHPVRINGIDHDLARALTDAAADPLNALQTLCSSHQLFHCSHEDVCWLLTLLLSS